MQHYEAQFADGYVIRRRAMSRYSFAWRVFYRINGELKVLSGFSISRERAEAAISAHAKVMSKRTSRSTFASSEIVSVQKVGADEAQGLRVLTAGQTQ